MKRIISILLISVMLISVSGCKSKQQAEDAKNTLAAVESSSKIEGVTEKNFLPSELEGEIFADPVPTTIKTSEDMVKYYGSCEVFVGKIITAEVIKPDAPVFHLHNHIESKKNEICGRYYRTDRNHEELFLLDSNLYLYTVEIEKTINSVFTTEKTTIQVIDDVPYKDWLDDSSVPYEVGERYVMSGRLYQYGEKTVLREIFYYTAKVDSEGVLEGVGRDADIMNGFGSVETFVASKDIAKIFEKDYYLCAGYQKDYNLLSNSINVNSKDKNVQKLIADGKKALPIDSKFKMPVKTDVIGDLSDDENRIPTNAELKIEQGIAEY